MKTRLFKHIPGDRGVAGSEISFPGHSDVKLKSREQFIEQLTEFINYSKEHATVTSAYPIIGEWGQGKLIHISDL